MGPGGGLTIFHGTKDTLICGCYGAQPFLLSGRVPNAPKVCRLVKCSHEMCIRDRLYHVYSAFHQEGIQPALFGKHRLALDEMMYIMPVSYTHLAVFISYDISYFFLAFLSFIAFRELYSVLGFREADRRALFLSLIHI